MKTSTITEAKNGLSALIAQVRRGESVLILDRGVPVARLDPVTGTVDPTGRLHRLERAGIIRPGAGRVPLDILRLPGPTLSPGASGLAMLLGERESGR
jgi:prevent-host-death family protein